MIPDEPEVIAETVLVLSREHDLVFTSGGIGPTHDDITYQSIAKAFDRTLTLHPEATARIKETCGLSSLNSGQLRMVSLPSPDEVIFAPDLWVPLARVKNVLLLPGVPRLFRTLLDHWMECHLSGSGLRLAPRLRRLIRTDLRESVLAARLSDLQEAFSAHRIELGSYPKLLDDGSSFVVISVIGPLEAGDKVEEAVHQILHSFDGVQIDSD